MAGYFPNWCFKQSTRGTIANLRENGSKRTCTDQLPYLSVFRLLGGQHDDDERPLLPDHLPEVRDGGDEGGLGGQIVTGGPQTLGIIYNGQQSS